MTYCNPRPTIVAIEGIGPSGRSDRPWRVSARVPVWLPSPKRRWWRGRRGRSVVVTRSYVGDRKHGWIADEPDTLAPPDQHVLHLALERFLETGSFAGRLWPPELDAHFGTPPDETERVAEPDR